MSTPAVNSEKTYNCSVCEKPSSQKCSRCRDVSYCSIDCQKNDFPLHRIKCCFQFIKSSSLTLKQLKEEEKKYREKLGEKHIENLNAIRESVKKMHIPGEELLPDTLERWVFWMKSMSGLLLEGVGGIFAGSGIRYIKEEKKGITHQDKNLNFVWGAEEWYQKMSEKEKKETFFGVEDELKKVLVQNGFFKVTNPSPGDIIVYKMVSIKPPGVCVLNCSHYGKVVKVSKSVIVESVMVGHCYGHKAEVVPQFLGTHVSYYRKAS